MNKLEQVLSIQSESFGQWRMFAYLIRQLKTLGVSYYVSDGCIYATKGIAINYPCIVAHMDTVHKIGADLTILRVGDYITGFNRVTLTQTGIGGDDKVGIYLALEALKHFKNIKVAFFRDEEVGCIGSYSADMDFFEDCSFVLQGDRRGNSDFITTASGTDLSSKQFKKAMGKIIKRYGYKFEYGMMTDVMALKENGLSVSCANISCGYYNPHCTNEFVSVPDVENCRKMMFEIISTYGQTVFEHKVPIRKYKYNYNKDDVWDGFKPFDNTPATNYCDYCGQMKLLTHVSAADAYLCKSCEKMF